MRRRLTAEQAHHEEQNDRTHDRDQQAGKVEAGDSLRAEEAHDPTSNKRANDTDDDIGDGSHLLVLSHDDARDPPSDGAKYDPYNEVHFYLHENWIVNWSFVIILQIVFQPGTTIDHFLYRHTC